jgi:hypothetical protein
MKKLISLFASVILTTALYAQLPVFTWSKANTKPAESVDAKMVGYTSSGYFIVNKYSGGAMSFNPGITIEYFNNQNERSFTKDISFTSLEDLVNVLYFNNSLYVMVASYNKDAGKNTLSARAINTDGTIGKDIEAGSIAAEKLSKRGRFLADVSPDGSKLIVLTEPEYVKESNEKIGLTLFTINFSKAWSSEQTYSYPWGKSVNNIPFVNNAGNVFIVKNIDMKGSDEFTSVFSFDGKELKEHKIELDGKKKLYSATQAFSPSGNFVFGGYYTEDSKVNIRMGNTLHGSVLYSISNDGKNNDIAAINPFSKRKDVRAKYILFHGSNIILSGEDYTQNERAAPRDPSKPQTNEQMFAKVYHYSGGDISIDAFDEKGKPLYSSKVDKNRTSDNDNGTSVSYLADIINGKIVILFNDEKHKYDEKTPIVFTPYYIGVYQTVDPVTGEVAKGNPLSTEPVGGKGGDMLLRPDVFMKLDATHYIIRAENVRIYRMAKVSF